ncbi:MAG: ribonuclease P protein component [Gammaproteobacteria bacterium]
MSERTFGFSGQLRLRKPAEFKNVFADPVKSGDAYFTLLACTNSCGYPRLGLAITKKNIKRAVDRNKLKRTVRESFRLHQQKLTGIDVVVLARREAANASSEILKRSLERHWQRLINRCVSYS